MTWRQRAMRLLVQFARGSGHGVDSPVERTRAELLTALRAEGMQSEIPDTLPTEPDLRDLLWDWRVLQRVEAEETRKLERASAIDPHRKCADGFFEDPEYVCAPDCPGRDIALRRRIEEEEEEEGGVGEDSGEPLRRPYVGEDTLCGHCGPDGLVCVRPQGHLSAHADTLEDPVPLSGNVWGEIGLASSQRYQRPDGAAS